MKKLAIVAAVCMLSACAANQTTVDVTKSKLAVATHADLQAAAKYASDHGYTARAAVWAVEDAKLSAVETQINVCANAIAANLPKPIDGSVKLTPFLASEMAAEVVGNFEAVPAVVKINCAPFPIVTLPVLPKLP